MTATSTLTRKNQTTVPKAVTEALGMKPADQFLYEIEAGHVILRARTGRLADLLQEPPPAPPPGAATQPAAAPRSAVPGLRCFWAGTACPHFGWRANFG